MNVSNLKTKFAQVYNKRKDKISLLNFFIENMDKFPDGAQDVKVYGLPPLSDISLNKQIDDKLIPIVSVLKSGWEGNKDTGDSEYFVNFYFADNWKESLYESQSEIDGLGEELDKIITLLEGNRPEALIPSSPRYRVSSFFSAYYEYREYKNMSKKYDSSKINVVHCGLPEEKYSSAKKYPLPIDNVIVDILTSLSKDERVLIKKCISKVKLTDNPNTVYSYNGIGLAKAVGIEMYPYDEYNVIVLSDLYRLFVGLYNKSWSVGSYDFFGSSCISWFADIEVDNDKGEVRLVFNKKMLEYIPSFKVFFGLR